MTFRGCFPYFLKLGKFSHACNFLWVRLNLMKLIYSKSKYNSFEVTICIKIPFFKVSVTIEPGRSLFTVSYHKLFEK